MNYSIFSLEMRDNLYIRLFGVRGDSVALGMSVSVIYLTEAGAFEEYSKTETWKLAIGIIG